MKKFLSIALSALLLVSLASAASAEVLGLGIHTYINATDAGEKDGRGQVNSVVCTVILDDNKVIKAVQFDTAQTNVNFNAEGKVTTDVTAPVLSKLEKGADYGMAKASPIGKEWFEQIASLEEYCIGKTVEEVVGMKTYEKDENHKAVPDEADLKTSVTIDVGGYLAALEKAAANAR